MSKQPKHIYEFGPFRLDTAERLLLRDGAPVPLTPKAFDTLLVLIENSGRLMEKDDLMKRVWPETFVDEGGLTRNISSLRKALDSEANQYIETVPKRGYRFTAAVSELTEGADEIIVKRHAKLRVTTEEIGETERKDEALRKTWMRTRPVVLTLAIIILCAVGATVFLETLSRTRRAEPNAPLRSIVVLPFNQLTNDGGGDENLGIGLTDALITRLGSLRQLIVRPTSAVLRYAGASHDAAMIGRELNVEAVLDGTVQRVDGRVRVSLQLVTVRDGATLWASTIDEESKDIFRLEDSVAARVIQALDVKLANAEQAQLEKRGTNNVDAYSAYLKGRILWNKRTPDALRQSLAHLNSAIEHDPLYALAYAGLADTYVLLGEYDVAAPGDTFPKAKAAALKALDLDTTLGEAHTVIAYTLANYEWNFSGSEQEYRRALELSPNYATAHQWRAEYFSLMRRFDEARREIKQAQELDPLSPIVGSVAGLIEYHAHNYEQAIAQLRRIIELDPNFAPAHAYLSLAYEISNMMDEAFAEQIKFAELSSFPTQITDNFRKGYERGGFAGYLNALLELMQALESQSIYVSPFDKAYTYAKLGNREQALHWLEKGFDERVRYVAYINVDPFFDNLHDEPRFQELLKRIGLQA